MKVHRFGSRALKVLAAAAVLSAAFAVTAFAAGGLDLTTKYTGISAKPGDTLSFDLGFINTTGSGLNTTLSADGLPENWTGYFEGGNNTISSVYVNPNASTQGTDADPNLDLASYSLTIPDDAKKGDYSINLHAVGNAEGAVSDLTVHINVTDEAAGNNSLDTTYPQQQGAAGTTFTFNSTLRNSSSSSQLYSLAAEAPTGWNVTFKPSSQNMEVSSIEVNSHSTSTVTITVTPPDSVEAGEYEIPVTATSSTQSLTANLKVTITGTYDLNVQTADGRLSFDTNVGNTQAVTLNVINNGNIDLANVNLTAETPSGWTAEFSESTIDTLPAGQTKEITMNVTPGKDAMSGDYAMTVTAKNSDTSIDQTFRVTVKTSTRWGVVGICLIVLIVLGLSEVFRRFGRH